MDLTSLPSDPDDQFGWFHDLADEIASGRCHLDPNTRESLGRFLELQLPGYPLSDSEGDSKLIDDILNLRANEVAWNRSLQAAMVRADNASRAGSALVARQELERFSRECPWSLFSQIALDQAALYGGATNR